MTHELPTRFGKYVLLDRLAAGGMAEVFLAKASGVEDFERLLAIKCMRPELALNDKFTSMFIDEAKLAGRLSHANIVQIYELGRYEDQLYIAMELVEGPDLRRVIDRARETGDRIPESFAAYVISRAAFALDYAHNRSDNEGVPLCLVHRDISPPNLLISHEGEVKVVDFGIAKAADRISETKIGVLKGKIAYMSPEQARGDIIDRRTDIYTLAVVLYEVITGYRLFSGDTDFEILEQVKSGEIPDLRLRLPEASPEILSVLMTALAPPLEERYQQAGEMGKALEPLLIKNRSIFGASEAAAYLKKLFEEEYSSPRRLPESQIADIAAGMDDGWREKTETFHSAFGGSGAKSPPVRGSSSAPTKIGRSRTPSAQSDLSQSPARRPSRGDRTPLMADLTPTDETDNKPHWRDRLASRRAKKAAKVEVEVSAGSRTWWPWVLVMLLCVVGGSFVWYLWGPATAEPPPPPPVTEETKPFETVQSHGYVTVKVKGSKNAVIYVDGRRIGKAPFETIRVTTGTHVIKVQKPSGKSRAKTVKVLKKHSKKSPRVVTIKL